MIDYPKVINLKEHIAEEVNVQKQNVKKVIKETGDSILKVNQKIKWLYRNKYKFGELIKLNKKKSIILSNDSEYIVNNDKLIVITEKQYIDNTTDKKELLDIGMNIIYTDKNGNESAGKIKKLNLKKAIIEDKSKNEYIIDYDKIIIY
jgi:predicted DNA-binding protein YlxM (UPF0122 family)